MGTTSTTERIANPDINIDIDVEDFALKNNLMIEGLIELLLSKGLIDRSEFIQVMLSSIDTHLEELQLEPGSRR